MSIRDSIALMLVVLLFSCNSLKSDKLKYIDPIKPSLTPRLFAPNFISTESESEFGSVFTKNGNEFYFAVDKAGKSEIRYTQVQNGKWEKPTTLISHKKYSYNDPFLSPDEKRLYYISDMPRNKADTISDIDIWYSKKVDNKWSDPINAGPNINSDRNEYYISFTSSGKMYFSSNKESTVERKHDFDIYSSVYENGIFQRPIALSDSINTGRYEADVYIAPDESYIIYCSAKREGYGKGDLYISFRDDQGEWSKPKNMGQTINSKNHELCPFVTLDGKYFFYTSNNDIYWVDAKIIEQFR